jgi:hypothetical protein
MSIPSTTEQEARIEGRGSKVEPRSWPPSWGLALAGQFLFVFGVLALSGPGRMDIVDGQTRYDVARSLIDHGDCVIRDREIWFTVFEGREGAMYSNYRFPQSVAGLPAILIADATGGVSEMRRHFFFTLISPFAGAILALTYSIWFRGLGHSPRASLAWATAGIFCTPNWYYSTSTFDDLLGSCTIVMAVAVAWLCRDRRPLLGAAVAGLLLAWAINCKPPLGLLALPVLAACYRPSVPLRQQLASGALVLSGMVLGVLAYKLFDFYKFPDGIDLSADRIGTVWTWNLLPGLANLALSPATGVVWYCPTVILSYYGWRRWRTDHALFCLAMLAGCGMFTLFICFLTFFKGDYCWGPRYLTPVLALGWLFVPASAALVRRFFLGVLLGAGMVVQLLGLSMDPQRLHFEQALPWGFWSADPWLGFHPATSNLLQRPKEIVDVLRCWNEPAPRFGPATLPTHAGTLNAPPYVSVTSLVGLVAAPPQGVVTPIGFVWDWKVGSMVRAEEIYHDTVHHYHIFSTFRPWWIAQWYLSEDERPVNLARTLALLSLLSALGLVVMIVAARRT